MIKLLNSFAMIFSEIVCEEWIYSFPNYKILALTKLKGFSGNNFDVA